jgi:hypothetical protein
MGGSYEFLPMAALAVTVSSAFVAFGFAYIRFPGATRSSAWCRRP